jgi:hypothetical protein
MKGGSPTGFRTPIAMQDAITTIKARLMHQLQPILSVYETTHLRAVGSDPHSFFPMHCTAAKSAQHIDQLLTNCDAMSSNYQPEAKPRPSSKESQRD